MRGGERDAGRGTLLPLPASAASGEGLGEGHDDVLLHSASGAKPL
jgi:hypothetical protein